MNNVLEQCPKSDSETILSPKTGWVHQVHSLLASQPTQVRAGAPRRPRVAMSQPAQCRIVGAQPAVSQRIGVVSQAPSGHIVGTGRRVVAWPPGRVTIHLPASCPCPCHNTPRCIAIQSQPNQPPSHNTPIVLPYNGPA